jgi:hypothetical protein
MNTAETLRKKLSSMLAHEDGTYPVSIAAGTMNVIVSR